MKSSGNKQIREECGIVGVLSSNAPQKVLSGLKTLQHRGQEGWGVATQHQICKEMGLIPDSVQLECENIAIGHNRYSTTGENSSRNLQPIAKNNIILAHNGNIIQNRELKELCLKNGATFETQTDSETLLNLIVLSDETDFVSRISDGLSQVRGAFCLVLIYENKLYAVRDPWGIRPLMLGRLPDGWIVASETVAIDKLNGQFLREVEPMEIISLDLNSVQSYKMKSQKNPHFCAFEYIYLSHGLSRMNSRPIDEIRTSMGQVLAQEDSGPQGQVVSFVPDTSMASAQGFAREKNLPLVKAMTTVQNLRTFIQPSQAKRLQALREKHVINTEVILGKDISLVDDSLVRGNTARVVIAKLKKAGARKIHLKIASPPIVSPCFYGIDIPSKKELLASRMSQKEMCEFLNADSLTYLSVEGMNKAIETTQTCRACMTSSYPINFATISA